MQKNVIDNPVPLTVIVLCKHISKKKIISQIQNSEVNNV
jgi:hypothetical protein